MNAPRARHGFFGELEKRSVSIVCRLQSNTDRVKQGFHRYCLKLREQGDCAKYSQPRSLAIDSLIVSIEA